MGNPTMNTPMETVTEKDRAEAKTRSVKLAADDSLRFGAVAAYFARLSETSTEVERDGGLYDELMKATGDEAGAIEAISDSWELRGGPSPMNEHPILAKVDRSGRLPVIDLYNEISVPFDGTQEKWLKAFNAQDRKVSGMGYTELGDGKAPLMKCSELIARFSYNPKDGTFTTLDIDGD
jgi:hypothetical protein